MKFLTKETCEKMSNQMQLKARDIVCLYNILDGSDMPRDFILDCLLFYQNKDGGFGNGLFIDNYNPNSNVYSVYEAFRILDMMNFSCNDSKNELFDSLINKAGNYLYNRHILIDNKWNFNVETNKDFAHAKIFDFNEENLKLFGLHPTMDIVGYTLLFFKPTKAYYKKAYNLAIKLMDEYLNKKEVNKYDLIAVDSFINSIKKAKIDLDTKKIEEKLIEDIKNIISLDFNDDLLHPLDAMYIKDDKLDEARQKELDYLIDSVASFGLWDYKKSWGNGIYPEEDSAMLKWIGANTVNNYYKLKYFERIE